MTRYLYVVLILLVVIFTPCVWKLSGEICAVDLFNLVQQNIHSSAGTVNQEVVEGGLSV